MQAVAIGLGAATFVLLLGASLLPVWQAHRAAAQGAPVPVRVAPRPVALLRRTETPPYRIRPSDGLPAARPTRAPPAPSPVLHSPSSSTPPPGFPPA